MAAMRVAPAKRYLVPNLSAKIPPGSGVMMKPRKKADDTSD